MKSNKEYRAQALAALKGNWTAAALLTLVWAIIYCVPSLFGEEGNVGAFVSMGLAIAVTIPLSVGIYAAFHKLLLGEDVKLFDYSFREGFNRWGHNVGGMLLMGIYTFLWTLLLIVPGIIKSLSYAMTPFILTDKPELSANEAIELSMKMMDGHKLDLFVIYLIFLGLAILSVVTLFIGCLWLTPYMYVKLAAFYEDVKAEYESKQNVAA
jgi:uncharacterized membrane protein